MLSIVDVIRPLVSSFSKFQLYKQHHVIGSSTILLALLDGCKLKIANIGDCTAIVVRQVCAKEGA